MDAHMAVQMDANRLRTVLVREEATEDAATLFNSIKQTHASDS
jgi:hypothetical protein